MTFDRESKESEELSTKKPLFRRAVDDTVLKFEKLLSQYDPLQLVSAISKIMLMGGPEGNVNSETYSEPLVEYLMSLALSKQYPVSGKATTSTAINEVFSLWKELTNGLSVYFCSDLADRMIDPTEIDVRSNLLLSYIFRRGPAYRTHLERTFLELFEPHSQYLSDTIGFSAQDMHDFLQRAEKRIISAFNEECQRSKRVIERAYTRFSEWVAEKGLQNEPHENLMRRFMEENPDLANDRVELENYLESLGSYEVFEIRPENQVERAILDAMSCEFGENEAFLTQLPEWRGWPTNDTVISFHPIIRADDKYYIFHLSMTSRSPVSILEKALREQSPQYYKDRYLPSRDKYLNKSAVDLISTLLPGSQVYSGLYYTTEEQGQVVHCELDGLATYDDCLIIMEAKASRLPPAKLRGSVGGFEDSMKEILRKAQEQALRAVRYIHSAPTVSFSDERGVCIARIERNQFRQVFIVLVNLEPVYQLSSHLPTARRLDLLPGKEWPWFVYLNDLRVISEILEHPSTFLHYLRRRIALNDQPKVHAFDELDYFMCYIETGLLLTATDLQQADMIMVTGYTDTLDAYYSWLRGEGEVVPKPIIKMHPVFEQLISRLETEMPHHFVSTCMHLLDSDDETRGLMARGIENCEKRFKSDCGPKSFSLHIGKTGVLLGCMHNISRNKKLIARWGRKWLRSMDTDEVSAICWTPPIASGDFRAFFFSKDKF